MPIYGPQVRIFQCSSGEAELVKCLPKDLAGILHVAKAQGVDLTMLGAVQAANQRYTGSS